MEIPVLIERLAKHRYRAKAGLPFTLSTEGRSEKEALASLELGLNARLRNGARLVSLRVDVKDHPVARTVGTLDLSDPYVKKWLRAMEKNRQRLEDSEGQE